MFKVCTLCNHSWDSQSQFLIDPNIQYAGYQVNFKKHEFGFFLFNHNCGTTIASHVQDFANLYNGPQYNEAQTGTSTCTGYCLNEAETRICPAECKFAYARKIMQILIQIPEEKGG